MTKFFFGPSWKSNDTYTLVNYSRLYNVVHFLKNALVHQQQNNDHFLVKIIPACKSFLHQSCSNHQALQRKVFKKLYHLE